ncbi:MAG: acyl-CoA dehydrogenase family protein [Dehalococcoidia bacterium]|nr:MAG: acyl-CoA dehydrogenase family protein [Dehalococcoidia bacterium]
MIKEYTEEQEAIRRMVRDFARKEISPGAAERDATGRFDYDLYRRLGDLGITGMTFAEEYGGTGAGFLSACLAAEEIARVDMSLSWTLLVGVAGANMIVLLGSEEQKALWKEKWVLPVVRGEAVTSAAITEPDAGSDTAAIRTRAVLDGDEWVINGSKAFITNAGLENNVFTTVLCLTNPEDRRFDTIIVPKGTPGCTVMPARGKMGLRSSDTRELAFDDCRVPAINLLGPRGTGRGSIVRGFFAARIVLASTALGLAEECLVLALDYAKQRNAFGRPIAEFQHVQAMLVDMALHVELSRLIRDKAARLMEWGQPHAKESAMAKYFCCESAKQAADYAVQVFGAMGVMDETPVSRYYRDVRATTIADGTTQIQKHVIARELGCFR